jgi:hypothetical protein
VVDVSQLSKVVFKRIILVVLSKSIISFGVVPLLKHQVSNLIKLYYQSYECLEFKVIEIGQGTHFEQNI